MQPGPEEWQMVDEQVFREEIRSLKALIRDDPAIRARYDLDGDGEISGSEWDQAVTALRAELERHPHSGAEAARAVFETVRTSSGLTSNRPSLANCREVIVKQRVEKREIFYGYECSNRYVFIDPDSGEEMGGADESSGGFGGFLCRAFLGPARPLGLAITDPAQGVWMEARRPFSPLGFVKPPTLTVNWNHGMLGTVTRIWPLVLRRRYRVSVANDFGSDLIVDGSLFKPWTFPILKNGRSAGFIQKKWSGVGRELFTDADNFLVRFDDPDLDVGERRLLVAAALAIDYDFFEKSPGD
jgi:hypothetical protein